MKAVIKCAIVVAALVAWASPAMAQQTCDPVQAGEIFIVPELCGTVWNDTNRDGLQNDDEDMDASNGDSSVIEGAVVTLFVWNGMTWDTVTDTVTNSEGYYYFDTFEDGQYKIVVSVPTGTEPSPFNVGSDDTIDSEGMNDNLGAATEVTIGAGGVASQDSDFGFRTIITEVPPPGTGTPGYWKNHSWPVASVSIGGVSYTRDQALTYMGKVSKDKTITIFSSLLAAKLNVIINNPHGCIDATIAAADAWFAIPGHAPGSGVLASSADWQDISDEHAALDDYNNGRLCAPHRN